MRVTFVALGAEALGISQLAAIARRDGHRVGLAFSASLFHDRFNLEIPSLAKFFDDRGDVIDAIREQQPDVLAFSCLTSTYQWMLGIAREAKELFPEVKTVFGGVHVSAVPDRAIARDEVDYAVAGEADVAFPLILDAIAAGGPKSAIPNTRFKTMEGRVIRGVQQGFVQDLDALPHYDKAIWEDHIRIGDLYLTMATRGCPYTCSFCFNNFFSRLPEEKRGKYVRQRSVDHVMHELNQAKKRYTLHAVDFQDDVFTVSKPWIKEFTERYKKEIRIPFSCLIHPQYFDDEIARWMSDAGCRWIQMGIQTMDEKFKHEHLRRYEESDHILRAMEAMHRHGINLKVDHMLGLPGEQIGSQATALQLYKEQTPNRIQTFWTCFLPGTDMMKQAVDDGTISQQQAERLHEGEDFYFFRNKDNINNPELVRMYQYYEIIYRILPSLPGYLKKRIKPSHLRLIPYFLAMTVAYIADIIANLKSDNRDFVSYTRHYIFHLYRFFLKRFGFKPPKATMPAGGPDWLERTVLVNPEQSAA